MVKVTDDAGNLVFDGYLYFVYDAWNRVVQVSEARTLEISTNGPTQGQLIGTPGSALARADDQLDRPPWAQLVDDPQPTQPGDRLRSAS